MSNKLHIKIGPIDFEIEGDGELIEREREQFFRLLPQAISAVSPVTPVSPQFSDSVKASIAAPVIIEDTEASIDNGHGSVNYESLAELIRSKHFSTDVETTMGAAYYLQFCRGSTAFTARDIEQAFDDERQNKPKNISQMIIQNIKKGYLREQKEKVNGRKSYCVLERGKNWFETYAAETPEVKKKTVKSKANKPTAESSLLSIPLDELHLEKYCDITQLTKFNEQMLVLMLMYTKEKGIEYFSFNDIVSVLKVKFKIPATDRKVRYAFDCGGTKFDKKVEKKVAYHKLMTSGIKEAERIVAEQQKDNNYQ